MTRSVSGGGGVAQSDTVRESAIISAHDLATANSSALARSTSAGSAGTSGTTLTDAPQRPLAGLASFSLLDGAGEPVPAYSFGKNTACTFKCADTGFGYRRFIMRKALKDSDYIKDSCFRVRCDVTVSTVAVRVSRSVNVPLPDMHQHIGRLLESHVGTDITFQVGEESFAAHQVGEESFAAHQVVLAARSPVFMAQLFCPMKEPSTSHAIRIDDMEPRVFRAMLHFIYTDSLPELDSGDDAPALAQHLLVAADRYGLERLKLICEDRLCHYINTGMAATTLVLAEQHGSRALKEACFEFLKSPGNLKATMNSDEFQHLTKNCPSLLSELLADVAP